MVNRSIRILHDIDLENAFTNKNICDISSIKQKLEDNYKEEWLQKIEQKPKLRFYKTFKHSLQSEKYVSSNISRAERSFLAQFRFGILPIHVETGRFNRTPLEERTCAICGKAEIEDEEHFLLKCSKYKNTRNNLFNKCRQKEPNFENLNNSDKIQIMMTSMVNQSARYIKEAYNIRFNTINK